MLSASKQTATAAFHYDRILALVETISDPQRGGSIELLAQPWPVSKTTLSKVALAYVKTGIAGAMGVCFKSELIDKRIDVELERKTIAMKMGFPSLPATTCSLILNGFGLEVDTEQVLSIYASYGMSHSTKSLSEEVDFWAMNRRAGRLQQMIDGEHIDELRRVHQRYLAIGAYLAGGGQSKEQVINASGMSRSLFFFYWNSFKQLGILGLVDKAKKSFRVSKIGLDNEAQMVVDKAQKPDRTNHFYISRLASKDIDIDRTTVTKILARWNVGGYQCKFKHNLDRLGSLEPLTEQTDIDIDNIGVNRMADSNFLVQLNGLCGEGLAVDAPGLFTLWCYLEELGILSICESMGLTGQSQTKGCSWFDLLLLNIARIFYGIGSYSRTCQSQHACLPFFCHLLSLPCNDTFLNGLSAISEQQVYTLRKWLVKRGHHKQMVKGRKVVFDFHQIDMDVLIAVLRCFGKGPSPKKKICYEGLRPHIAWDVETGCLIVAEFRKSSARGTTTVKRFITDYMLDEFRDLFDTVYIDSEYTGKEVWQFILEAKNMSAHLTACLKQNAFVRKHRDEFINAHQDDSGFWKYYDDDYCYGNGLFDLVWPVNPNNPNSETLRLKCTVKKNIKTGKLRCFGTSKPVNSPVELLEDYSNRWTGENGIKDLVISYFLDNCPGNDPHQVDVHFLIVTIARLLYRMIERDLSEVMHNPDGSTKCLQTMRDILFRQGCARVRFEDRTMKVEFKNSFDLKTTNMLRFWFELLSERFPDGMNILGGFRLEFHLRPPYGEEHRNTYKKIPLNSAGTLR
jgi:hypothetical protein